MKKLLGFAMLLSIATLALGSDTSRELYKMQMRRARVLTLTEELDLMNQLRTALVQEGDRINSAKYEAELTDKISKLSSDGADRALEHLLSDGVLKKYSELAFGPESQLTQIVAQIVQASKAGNELSFEQRAEIAGVIEFMLKGLHVAHDALRNIPQEKGE